MLAVVAHIRGVQVSPFPPLALVPNEAPAAIPAGAPLHFKAVFELKKVLAAETLTREQRGGRQELLLLPALHRLRPA